MSSFSTRVVTFGWLLCLLLVASPAWGEIKVADNGKTEKEGKAEEVKVPAPKKPKRIRYQAMSASGRRQTVITASELLAFRWNYFGLSHTFTLDAQINNLWGTDHFLLNSYLSIGVQHYFSSQNTFRFYVGFQPLSILDFQFRAGIFHTYGQFNSVLRSEQYSEYYIDDLNRQRENGDVVETKLGLSMRLRARLKLQFWRIILLNAVSIQFFAMFGFNDDTYPTPRQYYAEPISTKHLHANDFVLMNDTFLFFEVLRYGKGDRRKLWLGFYNEYVNAVNYKRNGQTGDPTNKLGLIGIWTPLKHVGMPTIVVQFKLWVLDRYLGLIRTDPAAPGPAMAPNFEFVAAINWDFSLFQSDQVRISPSLRER